MKLVLERSDLLRATGALSRVLPRKSTLPVLQCVRLIADPKAGVLDLEATDVDRWLKLTFPVEVERGGSVLIEGQGLARIAAATPEGAQIEFSAGDSQLSAKSGTSRFRLPLSADEFPAAKHVDQADAIDLSGAQLSNLLQPIAPAMSSDDTRPYLNGIFLQLRNTAAGGELNAIATDGGMMAWSRMKVAAADGVDALRSGIIIPDSTISILPALFADDDMVQLRATAALLAFSTARVAFVTKLVDGTFPDCDRIVPSDWQGSGTIEGAAGFRDIVKGLSPFAEGTKDGRAIHFDFRKDKVRLACGHGDQGGAGEYPIRYEGLDCPYAFADRLIQPAVDARPAKKLSFKVMPEGVGLSMIRIDYDQEGAAPQLFFIVTTLRVTAPPIANDDERNQEDAA